MKLRRATLDDVDAIVRLQGEHLSWGRRAVATIIASGSMDVIVEYVTDKWLIGVVFLLPYRHHYKVVGCYPVDIDLLTSAVKYRNDGKGYYVSVSDLETQWHLDLKHHGWTALKVLRRDPPDRDHYLFVYRGDYGNNNREVIK